MLHLQHHHHQHLFYHQILQILYLSLNVPFVETGSLKQVAFNVIFPTVHVNVFKKITSEGNEKSQRNLFAEFAKQKLMINPTIFMCVLFKSQLQNQQQKPFTVSTTLKQHATQTHMNLFQPYAARSFTATSVGEAKIMQMHKWKKKHGKRL